MLSEPCTADLVNAPYGGTAKGYLYKATRSIFLHGTAANNTGYIMWDPNYVCNYTASASMQNSFWFEAASGTSFPTNTIANPYGLGVNSAAAGGTSFPSPAGSFLVAQTASTFRTVAACMRITYQGTTSGASGVFRFSNNYPANNVLGLLGGNGLSVSAVDAQLPHAARVNNVLEMRWFPSQQSSVIARPVSGSGVLDNDAGLYQLGVPTTTISSASTTAVEGSPIMALSWSGLNTAQTNDYRIDFYQIVEWFPGSSAFVQVQDRTATQDYAGIWHMINMLASEHSYKVISDGIIGLTSAYNDVSRAINSVRNIVA